MTRITGFIICLAAIAGMAFGATPPSTVNYEGVLRDQNGNPLSGTYDMVFRFMDAATGGSEILIDRHLGAGGVIVSGGLFNVALGSGVVVDGSGPNVYTNLATAFKDYAPVWLEVQVGAETLSPRIRFHSAAYALNSTNLNGLLGTSYINTTTTPQTKNGPLTLHPFFGDNSPPLIGENNNFDGIGAEFIGGPGAGGTGLEASGYTGGRFSSGPTVVEVAKGGVGIEAVGVAIGGRFNTSSSSSTAVMGLSGGTGGEFHGDAGVGVYAVGPTGVSAYGVNDGGFFDNGYPAVSATLADDAIGISATGIYQGSYFSNGSPYFGYADIPYFDVGIRAHGSGAGGEFRNFGSGAHAYVGIGGYKILGSGAVSFVQNHPADPAKVIVYAAPEGDEVAVYTRGSGRLVEGEAHVALGETFALVANPDIGLTATVTPIGEAIPLAVVEKTTSSLVIRGPVGSNAAFDYVVWGLRIGFEELAIVQPKRNDSRIPSMAENENFFAAEPALRKKTALARFKGIEESVTGRSTFGFTRAERLREQVGVFEARPAGTAPPEGWRDSGASGAPQGPATAGSARAEASALPSTPTGTAVDTHEPAAAAPELEETDEPRAVSLYGLAPSDVIMTAASVVEAGDLVSLDAASPGGVVRSSGVGDALIIGCARDVGPGSLSDGQIAVATGQIALCRVDAAHGAVGVGDRLTASPSPGIAMRADPSSMNLVVFGRAIEPLEAGSGLIRVLMGVR